jgi:hypothetical protein
MYNTNVICIRGVYEVRSFVRRNTCSGSTFEVLSTHNLNRDLIPKYCVRRKFCVQKKNCEDDRHEMT